MVMVGVCSRPEICIQYGSRHYAARLATARQAHLTSLEPTREVLSGTIEGETDVECGICVMREYITHEFVPLTAALFAATGP